MKYIYHHLGLGDHIICNGLVRYFKELHGEVKKEKSFEDEDSYSKDSNN